MNFAGPELTSEFSAPDSGVCHTDLHAMLGDWPVDNKLPLIGGHEGAGYIVAMNDDQSELKVGDNVGIKWIAHR